MYPLIEIDLDGIIDNIKIIENICKKNGISLSLVTKLLPKYNNLIEYIVNSGVKCICESRIGNLKSIKNIEVEKWLIRNPMICEIEDVVRYSDVSFNTEIKVIRMLDTEAMKQNKIHKIILMYELGDLREGLLKDELDEVLSECLQLKNIKVYGIGSNLSCYGQIIPDEVNMNELINIARYFEKKYCIEFEVISGGNSSSYDMLSKGLIPSGINNLRIGEAAFLGNLPCFDVPIEELNKDNFILKAQIIELKTKPSIPWGTRGNCNSFGEDVKYVDMGNRKRAIIALGKQDVKIDGLRTIDDGIIILGSSSDHTILDVTDSKYNYDVGDIIEFRMDYSAVATSLSSGEVKRKVLTK